MEDDQQTAIQRSSSSVTSLIECNTASMLQAPAPFISTNEKKHTNARNATNKQMQEMQQITSLSATHKT